MFLSQELRWAVTRPVFQDVRLGILITLTYLAMASRGFSADSAEQLTQLLIGILCTCGLLYFSYIELINPTIVVSDRLFTTLVALIVASVGLREFQYRYRGQSPPPGGGPVSGPGSESENVEQQQQHKGRR